MNTRRATKTVDMRLRSSSTLVQATALAHVASIASTCIAPTLWPWSAGVLAANHALITATGLLPRSTWLGPNIRRLPNGAAAQGQIALSFDDGPDPVITPQVLELLDVAQVRASFFCIGWRARQHPALCRAIVARGHRVENHGDSHSNAFSLFGPKRMWQDVTTAQATLADITGQAPQFFRPTAGLRNIFLQSVLEDCALQLATWTRRPFDTREGRPEIVLQRLCQGLAAGDILLMHDGQSATTAQGEPVILACLPQLLAKLKQQGLRAVTLSEAFEPTKPQTPGCNHAEERL